ncbi:MAG: glycoside hydrolase family 3 N-terminal domain-containing protein [Microbacterium sp.]|uniref:glycoside hydrolase family 3 N-terminal domain-containing protein n=1 Tax=Microbacterium sp. TaxID=51671 RepID=UPI003A8C0DBD
MKHWVPRGMGLLVAAAAAATFTVGGPTAAAGADESASSVQIVAAAVDDTGESAAARVAGMTTEQKAATVVMGHIATTDATVLHDYMQRTQLGGFILMGANIPADEGALRAITAALTIDPALPPLLAVDEEGGQVTRLPWDDFPAANTLKNEPPEATRNAFRARAALVQRAGIGVNFGIVADIADGRSSFIYGRALGTSPDAAAERVAAAVTGEHGQVQSTLKHFPGHGAAPGDSHAGIPATDMAKADWAAADGRPFAAGVDAGAQLVMFGHLRYRSIDQAPASLSSEWHRILRDELGFTGLAITDDLGMLQASGEPGLSDPVANAVAALRAGNDMVVAVMFTDAGSAGSVIAGIVAAVATGDLPAERLDEAATRVTALRLQVAAGGRGFVPCPDCAAAG